MTATLTDELSPCPFCGGRAEYEQTEGALHEVRWTIGCLENNNRNNLCMAYQSLTTFATKREARLAWNTRHRSSPSAEWKPIDTAPKDGTRILLATRQQVGSGKWGHAHPWGVARDGWFYEGCDMPTPATRWQPLPEPPK